MFGRCRAGPATAVVAVLVAVVAAVPARADVTVTINNQHPNGTTENGPTYNWYVMMWASVDTNNSNRVSYYVNKEDLAKALDNLKVGSDDLFTVERVGTENHWNVSVNKKSDDTAFTGEEIANALNSIVSANGADLEKVTEQNGAVERSTETNKQFTITDNGYVLITSSLGSKLVVDTFNTKTVNEKNTYPTSDKTQSTAQNGTYDASDLSREIGQVVYYHVTVTIPSTATKDITVVDTTTKGLTLNTDITATVDHGTAPQNLIWSENSSKAPTDAPEGSKTYTVTIPETTVRQLASAASDANAASATLTLSYSATVNSQAVAGTAESNKAHIEYDNFVTKDVEVKVYTYKFNLLKYDGAQRLATGETYTPIADAKFQLLKGTDKTAVSLVATDSGDTHSRYRVATTGDTGAVTEFATVAGQQIEITGLDKDSTYYLRETEAPPSFNRLTEDVQVNHDDEASYTGNDKLEGNNLVVQVANHQGSVLPSTGGAGTVAFYVIGGALMAGAVVFAVSRRRAAGK